MLTQTERLVTIEEVIDGVVTFMDEGERTGFAIDREAWDDMDRPTSLTVTVRPGDHLN